MRALRLLVLGLLATPLLSGCFAVALGGAAVGAAHDRRAFNTIVDDRNIQLSAYDNLNKDEELALKNNVDIVVYDGTMLLIGEVRTDELKGRAEARTTGFEGVRRVVNEIEV